MLEELRTHFQQMSINLDAICYIKLLCYFNMVAYQVQKGGLVPP